MKQKESTSSGVEEKTHTKISECNTGKWGKWLAYIVLMVIRCRCLSWAGKYYSQEGGASGGCQGCDSFLSYKSWLIRRIVRLAGPFLTNISFRGFNASLFFWGVFSDKKKFDQTDCSGFRISKLKSRLLLFVYADDIIVIVKIQKDI